MAENIFITGKPGCGKTSLIIKILEELKLNARLRQCFNGQAGGFYTQEIRERGARKGFKIITLNGQEGILAHINIESAYRVSRYKVNIKDLEEVGVKSILDSLEKNKITVVDEVGKIELFSEKFKKAVWTALDSKNKVLGTITLSPDSFCDKIKKRPATKIFYLTRENREKIKEEIIKNLILLEKSI